MARALERFGTDRGGMWVEVEGHLSERRVRRSWTLVAGSGHGPSGSRGPSRCARAARPLERPATGGRSAFLARFPSERLWPSCVTSTSHVRGAVRRLRTRRSHSTGEYSGSALVLPAAIRRLHDPADGFVARGCCQSSAAAGSCRASLGWSSGCRPPASTSRSSCVSPSGAPPDIGPPNSATAPSSRRRNTLAPVPSSSASRRPDLTLEVSASSAGIDLVARSATLFGIPLPRVLTPRVEARERVESCRFRFEVAADLPRFGRLIRYCASSGAMGVAESNSCPSTTYVQRPLLATSAHSIIPHVPCWWRAATRDRSRRQCRYHI